MKAVIINTPGGPENLQVVETAVPEPSHDQVLVKIKAFGLNRSELMTRKGLSPLVSFPRVLGIECVGTVEHDPSGELLPGQKVAACMGGMGRDFNGSYAEYAVLPRAILTPFESQLDWVTLGALPEMFETAYGSLHTALKMLTGECLLIRGGSSSVGLLAAQMARNQGVRVISTTRDDSKREFLLANGSDVVLIDDGNLSKQLKASGYQIQKALELIGTPTLKDTLNCVIPGGLVCMTGMLSESWSIVDFAPMEFIPAAVGLTIYDSGQLKVEAEHFQCFIEDVERGRIKPAVKKVFGLDQIVIAHQLMESNSGAGKIVILN